MQQTAFDPHARILHSGQYKIQKTTTIDVPIKNFDSEEQAEKNVQKRIHDMHLEIGELEAKIAQKRLQNESKADEILERVQNEAKKVMEEAEQHAFNRVQKSVEEKEQVLQKTAEEVDRIKREAESDADKIRNKANLEAVQIQEESKKEGYKKGHLEGIDQGLSDVKFVVERLHSIVAETARERERILVHSESQVIDLVLSMVNKVVKKLSVEHQNVVIENVKAGLELLRGVMTIFIRVSPHDFNYVSSFKEELINMIESRSDIKFIEDPTIDPGGVYIETDMGDVDVTIRSQLEELENQMRFYMPVKVKSPEEKRREKENSEIIRKDHEDKIEEELKKKIEKTPFAEREEYKTSSNIIKEDNDTNVQGDTSEKNNTPVEETQNIETDTSRTEDVNTDSSAGSQNDTQEESTLDKNEKQTEINSTIDNIDDEEILSTQEDKPNLEDSDVLEDIQAEIIEDDPSVQDPIIESYKENSENTEESPHDDIIG